MEIDPASPPVTKAKEGSLILFVLSVVCLVLTFLVGAAWVSALVRHQTDPAFAGESISQAEGFAIFSAFGLGLVIMLSTFVPASFMYSWKHRRRDLLSLRVSGLSLALLFLQALSVFILGH